MKKKKVTKIIIAIISLFILGFLIWYMFTDYYSISDRVDKIKNEATKTKYPIIGWIRVQGTNIDYPVMYEQAEGFDIDNMDIDYGFAWKNYYTDDKTNRIVLLGHNIRNVSSQPLINQKNFNNFENLPSFLYYKFAKENKYIQYSDGNENHLYKIYAVYLQKSALNYASEQVPEDRLKEYIDTGIKNSYFKYDIDVNEKDKIITLMTCTRFFDSTGYSIVVDARMVRKDERINNYKVTKKGTYNKLEKYLEGDDSNEEKA